MQVQRVNNTEVKYPIVTDRMSFLIEINRLKNDIINSKDLNEQIEILCKGIIHLFGMVRAVFYRPLSDDRLHAIYEFIKTNDTIRVLKGKKVYSSFNPPRKIVRNERMYQAFQNGYFIKLMDSMDAPESTFILICIKDKDGKATGYLKIERNKTGPAIDDRFEDNNELFTAEKNELFVRKQRDLLSEMQDITERITELSSFITLSGVSDPYYKLKHDVYDQERLDSLKELINQMKLNDSNDRYRYLPELVKIFDAESIRLYSKSSHDIVKTVGLWNKESEVPEPIYKSSFLKDRRIVTSGDSMYYANMKGHDIVIDVSINPKCLNMNELSNTTSYIIVRLMDQMSNVIGFLQVNYVFRNKVSHNSLQHKLKKDLDMLRTVIPYLNKIPESEEFTHNPATILKRIKGMLPDINIPKSDNELVFHYISDMIIDDTNIIEDKNIPELVDNLRKLSYFMSDKRSVIYFFRWLYDVLEYKYKAFVVSSITMIFENFTYEQGKELSVFRDDCYDTLSAWMRSEIKHIITRKDKGGNIEILEQLLQLNCIFVSKYRDKDFEKCTTYLESLNINDMDNVDFLFYLYILNPSMDGSFIREIYKSIYYLINNKLITGTQIFETLELSLKIIDTHFNDIPLISQTFSTIKAVLNYILNHMEEFPFDTIKSYVNSFSKSAFSILSGQGNWHAHYIATLLLLHIQRIRNKNAVDFTEFNEYILNFESSNNLAILEAIRDFLISHSIAKRISLKNVDNTIRTLLSLLRDGTIEVVTNIKETLILLGDYVSGYERYYRESNFMNILINELSCDDINYKLTIHHILYTLKMKRMELHKIHPDTASHSVYQDSYITAISSPLGFTPFDIGEKGYHLLEIMGQCRIPLFLLLKTLAYSDFINHNGLANKIKNIIESIRFESSEGIEERIINSGKIIQDLIMHGSMPDIMEIELIDKFTRFKEHIVKLNDFVTIGARSTAKGEDGRLYSFAGQFLTILDIKNPEEFINTLKRIWASLWSPKAISYRHNITKVAPELKDRFSYINIGMGVVIQGVVNAATSGVIMTTSGGGIVVSGSYGLEGGTRSNIPADKYILDMHGEITDKVVSVQESAVCWFSNEKQFRIKDMDSDKQDLQKVPDSQLKILFEIVDRLKRMPIFIGQPLDVEYAITSDYVTYITQIRPKTTYLHDKKKDIPSYDFSGFYALKMNNLQTFTLGNARGRILLIKTNDDRFSSEIKRTGNDSIIVARHLDIPDLEVYLKRRPPAGIILETCTPFAHPVLVVSEMKKEGKYIPIIQIPDATSIFKNGMEIGIEVHRENILTLYSREKRILDILDRIKSPVKFFTKGEIEINKNKQDNNLKEQISQLEIIENYFVKNNTLMVERFNKLKDSEQKKAFEDIYTLGILRQAEIENLLSEQSELGEDILCDWYQLILQKFNGRLSTQYEFFREVKITPFLNNKILHNIEAKVDKNAALLRILSENFKELKKGELWHPRELIFQLNSPIFLIDPKLKSNLSIHIPINENFNLWEFSIITASQNAVFHSQLGTLVPYSERNKYIRGRINSDPTLPETIMDLGFLDNTRGFYNIFEDRIGAMKKTAQILLKCNFHHSTQVEILPRMTEDFKDHGIENRIRLDRLSELPK